jgi:PTS system nitrogen regulatory IIA component
MPTDRARRIEELLEPRHVRCNAVAASRKRVLQFIADVVADEQISADLLFDGLMARERLGSTGLGEGVAIPHCRIACDQMRVAFISLDQPVDYEASDGEPVDLLFVLVVPEEEQHVHLEALAALAELFSSAENRAALRASTGDDELCQSIVERLAGQVPDSKSA